MSQSVKTKIKGSIFSVDMQFSLSCPVSFAVVVACPGKARMSSYQVEAALGKCSEHLGLCSVFQTRIPEVEEETSGMDAVFVVVVRGTSPLITIFVFRLISRALVWSRFI